MTKYFSNLKNVFVQPEKCISSPTLADCSFCHTTTDKAACRALLPLPAPSFYLGLDLPLVPTHHWVLTLIWFVHKVTEQYCHSKIPTLTCFWETNILAPFQSRCPDRPLVLVKFVCVASCFYRCSDVFAALHKNCFLIFWHIFAKDILHEQIVKPFFFSQIRKFHKFLLRKLRRLLKVSVKWQHLFLHKFSISFWKLVSIYQIPLWCCGNPLVQEQTWATFRNVSDITDFSSFQKCLRRQITIFATSSLVWVPKMSLMIWKCLPNNVE